MHGYSMHMTKSIYIYMHTYAHIWTHYLSGRERLGRDRERERDRDRESDRDGEGGRASVLVQFVGALRQPSPSYRVYRYANIHT